MKKSYGYVRVSSKDQNIDRQMAALEQAGILKDRIFIDTLSGKNFNRPRYKQLLKQLKEGDELFIKSIDRLGRNYDEIIKQWQYLTCTKNIDIIILDNPLLDTRNQINGLTGKFISDLVLQILSYVAQIERENIRQRQAEGIREAKLKGVPFGRPPKKVPEQFTKVAQLWLDKKISLRKAGEILQVSHMTFLRWVKKYIKEE